MARSSLLEDNCWNELDKISIDKSRYIEKYLNKFLDYFEDQRKAGAVFDFSDCSVGNILLVGVDLEAEIFAKLSTHQIFVLEMPIQHTPRLKTEGKKITIWDGLNTLFSLFKYKVVSR